MFSYKQLESIRKELAALHEASVKQKVAYTQKLKLDCFALDVTEQDVTTIRKVEPQLLQDVRGLFSAFIQEIEWKGHAELKDAARHGTSVENRELIKRLSSPGPDFDSSFFNHERVPRIQSEIDQIGIRDGKRVLHLGPGPFYITALAYSLNGAQVHCLDRELDVLNNIKSAKDQGLWPSEISENIHLLPAQDAQDFDFFSVNLDFIVVSSCIDRKDDVLKKILHDYHQADACPSLLVRQPQNGLKLLYDFASADMLENFDRQASVPSPVAAKSELLVLHMKH